MIVSTRVRTNFNEFLLKLIQSDSINLFVEQIKILKNSERQNIESFDKISHDIKSYH